VGWGHSCISDAARFAVLARARTFVPFHYDPSHDDATRHRLHRAVRLQLPPSVALVEAREGESIAVAHHSLPAAAVADGGRSPGAGGS
jgi:hypothetical protein